MLVAKTSLDGHLRGVLAVVTAMRDAGMEVIYGGQITPETIARTALEEDVDVLGLNVGGRIGPALDVLRLLHEHGMDDVLVVAGGPIPRDEVATLRDAGCGSVFLPGSSTSDIVAFVQEHAGARARPTA